MSTAIYNGQEVEVLSKNGGWSQVALPNGSTRKVRNGDLKAASAKAKVPATTKATKPARAKPAPTPRQQKAAAATDEDGRLIRADLTRYHVHDVKTPSGRKAIDRDDEVAALLRGKTLDEVYKLAAKETGDSVAQLGHRYSHLNPGMQRMNLGNKIRGARSAAARESAKA